LTVMVAGSDNLVLRLVSHGKIFETQKTYYLPLVPNIFVRVALKSRVDFLEEADRVKTTRVVFTENVVVIQLLQILVIRYGTVVHEGRIVRKREETCGIQSFHECAKILMRALRFSAHTRLLRQEAVQSDPADVEKTFENVAARVQYLG